MGNAVRKKKRITNENKASSDQAVIKKAVSKKATTNKNKTNKNSSKKTFSVELTDYLTDHVKDRNLTDIIMDYVGLILEEPDMTNDAAASCYYTSIIRLGIFDEKYVDDKRYTSQISFIKHPKIARRIIQLPRWKFFHVDHIYGFRGRCYINLLMETIDLYNMIKERHRRSGSYYVAIYSILSESKRYKFIDKCDRCNFNKLRQRGCVCRLYLSLDEIFVRYGYCISHNLTFNDFETSDCPGLKDELGKLYSMQKFGNIITVV